MEIYLLRHGDAETALFNTQEEDYERQLTSLGEEILAMEAVGLRRFIKSLDLILTSPLIRAVQTAEIFGKVFECEDVVKTNVLKPPCRAVELVELLATREGVERVLCVGHTPSLGEIASELVTGIEEEDFFSMRKGAIIRVDMHDLTPGAEGILVYYLDPDIPKLLGELLSGKKVSPVSEFDEIEVPVESVPVQKKGGGSSVKAREERVPVKEAKGSGVSRKAAPVMNEVEPPDDIDFDDEDDEEEEEGEGVNPFQLEV